MFSVLHKPFDGVIGVAALIELSIGGFVFEMRSHVDKLAAAHVATSNILEDKDVAILFEVGCWPKSRAVLRHAIWANAIRRPHHQDGILSSWVGIVRFVDGSEQLDAIAHGDPNFCFRVVRTNKVRTFVRRRLPETDPRRNQRAEKNENQTKGRTQRSSHLRWYPQLS